MTEVETHLTEARQALAAEDLHGTLAWIEIYLHALETQPPELASAVLDLYASVLEAWVDAPTAQLARATALDTDDPDTLHRLGRELLDRHELEPARGVLARASRFAPESPDLWHARAAVEGRLGHHGQAAMLLEQAPETVRNLPLTRDLHALACLRNKDPEPARAVAALPMQRHSSLHSSLESMLLRHDAIAPSCTESPEAEARAWHAIWTAEVAIAPLGAGKATHESVRIALAAVAEAVAIWNLPAAAVTAPEHRDSEILARALAAVLALPFTPLDTRPDAPILVALWDFSALTPVDVARLSTVPPTLLYLHQRDSDDLPLHVDIVGRLTRSRPPWGHDAEVLALVGEPPPARDPRPLALIAAELASLSHPPMPPEWRHLLAALARLPRVARLPALEGRLPMRHPLS